MAGATRSHETACDIGVAFEQLSANACGKSFNSLKRPEFATRGTPRAIRKRRRAIRSMTQVICFGRFELIGAKRLLHERGRPVDLGARAFDVLAALVERRGQVVTKQQLLDIVWPGRVVEENNLQVQISTLRKVLGSGAIATIPGRGYCFVLASRQEDGGADRSEMPRRHNLPARLVPLIGRETDLLAIASSLETTRMLTLTGVGGVGKTSLARELGATCLDRFIDGVWLVELAPLTDPRHVAKAIASALGIRDTRGTPLDALIAEIASSELLLLVDNCEHVIDDAARACQVILEQCERVRIVATSLEPLRIPGESQYRVATLQVPSADSVPGSDAVARFSAIRLFIERARSVDPEFRVDATRMQLVSDICRRVDGIPLAIELAAARLRTMPIESIHAQLDQRFELLTEGWRTAHPRQQTLRALVDWSYDLLDDPERAVFRRLATFAGGFTLRAAESVCAGTAIKRQDVPGTVSGLFEKSLLAVIPRAPEVRYSMLDTLREYSAEQLRLAGEEKATHERHLAHFVALAEEAEPMLYGPLQESWLQRLERDHDNLRVALERTARSPETAVEGLRLAGALGGYWWMHGYLSEGRHWLSTLLAATPDAPASIRAKALHACASIANGQSDRAAAWRYHEQGLEASRTAADPRGVANALLGMGYWIILNDQELRETARVQFDECLQLFRELDELRGMAMALNGLALVALAYGPDLATARRRHQDALDVFVAAGDRHGAGYAITGLGYDALLDGDRDEAQARYLEGLRLARELGDRRGIAESLDGLAGVAALGDDPVRAARLWGVAKRIRDEFECPMVPPMRPDYEHRIEAVRAQCGDDAFDRGWREGRAMDFEQALDYAGQPVGGG